jgi:hypothetical protein
MMETDADRRNMLLEFGGSDQVVVGDATIVGLYLTESLRASFDEVRVSGKSHVLQCLMSDVVANGIKQDDRVSVPGKGADFYVADIHDEDGMALIELRKE